MHADDVLSLGLGVAPSWKLVGQRLDTDKRPNELHIEVAGDCGARFAAFKAFLEQHGGKPGRIVEVVCDMSPAFLAAIGETFEQANVTVDWFHVVQLFTKAVDAVRKAETKNNAMPKALRWAVLKPADGKLTARQAAALAELEATDLFTATAWRIKEKLRWIRNVGTLQAAGWRITAFIRHARNRLAGEIYLIAASLGNLFNSI